MISILLVNGISPNAKEAHSTIWGGLLHRLHEKETQISDHGGLQMTTELLLSYGADLDLVIEIGRNTIIPKITEKAGDLQMENDV